MSKREPPASSLEARLSRIIGKPMSSGTWLVAPTTLGLEGCFKVVENRLYIDALVDAEGAVALFTALVGNHGPLKRRLLGLDRLGATKTRGRR